MKYLKYLCIFFVLFLGFLYWQLYVPVPRGEAPVHIEISQGDSFSLVAERLHEKKLIRSVAIFKLFARVTGLDREVHAGSIRSEAAVSSVKLLRSLARPENNKLTVTIPEGFTIFEIDKKLVSLGVASKGEFVAFVSEAEAQAKMRREFAFLPDSKSLEGYLFPDTYFIFSNDFHVDQFARDMLRNFEKKVVIPLGDELRAHTRSLSQIVTIASILEKEVRQKEDRATVSGILWKRLDNGWPLQADATVLYGRDDRSVSIDVLKQDSSHNTYTRQGLPATPIGNPGLETIRAAMNPTQSPYWFYLTDSEGKAIYARTNEEHNRNKREHLYK